MDASKVHEHQANFVSILEANEVAIIGNNTSYSYDINNCSISSEL